MFPGTFNPIHKAHLRVAEYALKTLGAEKIVFIPSYLPPHKNSKVDISEHKLNMVRLATRNNPAFEVSNIEYELGGKSYTYRTVCELRKMLGEDKKLKILIGTDAFRYIQSWYETDKLKNLVEFLVFYRDTNFDKSEFDIIKNSGYKFEFMQLDFFDVSSEDIRLRIKTGLPVNDFVEKEVEEYIIKNELYKD